MNSQARVDPAGPVGGFLHTNVFVWSPGASASVSWILFQSFILQFTKRDGNGKEFLEP